MLSAIWIASVILSAVSLLVIVLLVVRRLFTEHRSVRNAALRKQVLSALVRFSADRNQAELDRVLASAPTLIVVDASAEFLELVRGEDRDAVIAVLIAHGVPRVLARELQAHYVPRRLQAAEMLAHFSSDLGSPSLLTALDDSSREVRIAAAISLAELGVLPPLAELLHKIGVRGQRSRRLIELFRKLPFERMEELQDYVAREEGPEFTRAAAIDALSLSEGLYLQDLFMELVSDPAPEVVAAAVRALGRTGGPDAIPILARALTSADWEVRAEAAEAAGRIGDAALLQPLVGLLGDSSWTVRYTAARTLRQFGEEGRSTLSALAQSSTSRAQRIASLVLTEGAAA